MSLFTLGLGAYAAAAESYVVGQMKSSTNKRRNMKYIVVISLGPDQTDEEHFLA